MKQMWWNINNAEVTWVMHGGLCFFTCVSFETFLNKNSKYVLFGFQYISWGNWLALFATVTNPVVVNTVPGKTSWLDVDKPTTSFNKISQVESGLVMVSILLKRLDHLKTLTRKCTCLLFFQVDQWELEFSLFSQVVSFLKLPE